MITSYIYVSVLCFTAYVDISSAVSQMTVSVRIGETAILPCRLGSSHGRAVHIKWQRKSQTVFERIGKGSYENEGYKGRVAVPEENLRKGNCSLVLKKVKLSDAAVYNSYHFVTMRRTSANILINSVKLRVIDITEGASYMKWPILDKPIVSSSYSLIIVFSLLSWFFVYLFCKKILAF